MNPYVHAYWINPLIYEQNSDIESREPEEVCEVNHARKEQL